MIGGGEKKGKERSGRSVFLFGITEIRPPAAVGVASVTCQWHRGIDLQTTIDPPSIIQLNSPPVNLVLGNPELGGDSHPSRGHRVGPYPNYGGERGLAPEQNPKGTRDHSLIHSFQLIPLPLTQIQTTLRSR